MNTPKDDNCKDMKELLSAYRDAELDDREHSQVEQHLSTCSVCRDELAAVESVVSSLKSLPSRMLDRDFADDIESILKRAEAQERTTDDAAHGATVVKFERKSKRSMWIAAAAALSILMAVGGYLSTTGGGAPTVAVKPDKQVVSQVESASQPSIEVATNDVETGESNSTVPSEPDQTSSEKDIRVDNQIAKETTSTQIAKSQKPAASEPPVVASSSPKPPVASRPQYTPIYVDDLSDNEALVALTDMDEDYDDYYGGISTDEDGLYAIKM